MPRLDVFVNPIADQRRDVPHRVDVKADFLRDLGTRVVLPLRRIKKHPKPAERFNPVFLVDAT